MKIKQKVGTRYSYLALGRTDPVPGMRLVETSFFPLENLWFGEPVRVSLWETLPTRDPGQSCQANGQQLFMIFINYITFLKLNSAELALPLAFEWKSGSAFAEKV